MFSTLYKKIKTGAIQQWQVVVKDNSFYIIEGLVDGKKTESIPYICKAKNVGKKNETTPEQQASKEAQSAWQRKLDQGYSEDINRCDEEKFFQPMLAEKYYDFKDRIKYPIFSQPKLDGIRCIAKLDGMWSRKGKSLMPSTQHIYDSLKPLLEMGLIFDGELYCDKYKADFNKITSLVRKSKKFTPEILKEIKDNLEYWIYDVPSIPDVFSARYQSLLGIFEAEKSKEIVLVETLLIDDERELDEIYEGYLNNGIEGQIIRFDTPYEKYRTKNLLKRKEFTDEEFEILDVIEGEGNRTGTVGKFVLRLNETTTFEANIKGNFTYLRELLQRKDELIGKQATVKYPNKTPSGKPRFGYVVDIRDYE